MKAGPKSPMQSKLTNIENRQLFVVFLLFGLTPLVEFAIGWPLALRVVLAVVVLSPLGLCLGVFMPLGLRALAGLSEHPVE